MTHRVTLALAIHNHQPVGNFPEVFESAYRQSYLPMLEALERHPAARLALHYSGPLLDWLEAAHPEFLQRLGALVTRAQVELMTGGYYEPILAAIPERDRQGQIQKMTDYLKDRFGARATGLWLAERVWEPHLAKSIAEAGAAYTIVDDTHFIAAGVREEDLVGAFITEDEGVTLRIVPSRKRLRYLIPWQSPAEVIAYLRGAIDRAVLVMGDDGEKFGTWPGTFDLCWTQGWVDGFFQALDTAGDWLAVVPPGEAAARPPVGRVYLPTASYDEMMEWALPAEQSAAYAEAKRRLEAAGDPAAAFLRGGFWRQFLVKYPEINTMHKRMLRVGRKIHALPAGPRRLRALDELWRGQGNCSYWHGVFGGIYLPHIRAATFGHLIAAETFADGARVRADVADLDGDGLEEAELATTGQLVVVDPDGGGVVEWHWRPARVNLTNVLTRRPEAYHARLRQAGADGVSSGAAETIHTDRVRVKEPGLERLLVYDWYRRASFLDHILEDTDLTAENLACGAYRELGDFVNQPYTVAVSRSPTPGIVARLTRDGGIWTNGTASPLRVDKQLVVDPRQLRLTAIYRLENTGAQPVTFRLGIETDWAVTDPTAPARLDGAEVVPSIPLLRAGVRRIEIADRSWPGSVTLVIAAADVCLYQLQTVSNSEAGFERIMQGLTCLCLWRMALEPDQAWETTIAVTLAS